MEKTPFEFPKKSDGGRGGWVSFVWVNKSLELLTVRRVPIEKKGGKLVDGNTWTLPPTTT